MLGPVRLDVDGIPIRLTPLTTRLLVRLVAAEGEAVPVRQLRRDVWGLADGPRHLDQRNRNEVQKRVLELRRALDPVQDGTAARVLRTEQQVTVHGPETAYRLVLRPEELDSARFTAVVRGALLAPPATAAHELAEALALVRGDRWPRSTARTSRTPSSAASPPCWTPPAANWSACRPTWAVPTSRCRRSPS